MVIEAHELVQRFGSAVDRHSAAVLVGAGLSTAAGLPDWATLVEPLMKEIGVLPTTDLTTAADYFVQNAPGGRERLEAHLAKALATVTEPGEGHRLVTELGVAQIWTTNFDPLLEGAAPGATVISIDDQAPAAHTDKLTIVKMHGGFDRASDRSWRGRPVITRTDFESYDLDHPRLWALLQATYLTRTMLFLGFSFTDPNIELLLRLARRQGTTAGNRHLTVLKRPADGEDLVQHQLRVRDLESNGIEVCEIAKFEALIPLLRSIKRRTRPARVFVAGSGDPDALTPWCDTVGNAIAGHNDWEIASLGGEAGWLTSRRVSRQRRAAECYDPQQIQLFYRNRAGQAAPALSERFGTAIFSDHDRRPLVDDVIETCRAMVVVAGGDRTAEECALATAAGLSVIPIAASGGTARAIWDKTPAADEASPLGGKAPDPTAWAQLSDSDPYIVGQACRVLLEQAMYWQPSQ